MRVFSNFLLSLTRYQRRFVLALSDLAILNLALWLSISARYGYLYAPPDWSVTAILGAVPVIAVAAFFYVGLYRHVTRHFGSIGDRLIFLCVSISSLCLGLGAFIVEAEGIPRSILFLYPLIGSLAVSGSRRFVRQVILRAGAKLPPPSLPRQVRNVIVFQDGPSAEAVVQAVRRSRNLEVVGFVDSDPTMWRQYIAGIRVYSPDRLDRLIRSHNIAQILINSEQATRSDRLTILAAARNHPVEIRALPSMEDISAGRVSIDKLRNVEVEEFLGRPSIAPSPDLMMSTIKDRQVMVTGAGGSIGAELVRQTLRHNPSALILFSADEKSLYEIDIEAREFVAARGQDTTRIVTVLGSINNDILVRRVLQSEGVQTLFHAAAYKHVPIIEDNVVVGVRNNALGTETLALAAAASGVESFVLISTDKAVRPANVMGASKRLAEIIVQSHAARRTATRFSIVRFGNVLDSSGSVVRLFRRQIENGGPLTVTHPEVSRFFISGCR